MLAGKADQNTMSSTLKHHRLIRKVLFSGTIKTARILHGLGASSIAFPLLRATNRMYPREQPLLRTLADVAQARGDTDRRDTYLAQALHHRMPAYLKKKDFTAVLRLMAEMERTCRAAQFQAGRLIAEQLVSDEGRAVILAAAQTAQTDFPDSLYLAHLVTLCQAKAGDYRDANDSLVTRIRDQSETPHVCGVLAARRTTILQQSWRVVDLLAREQMDWADGDGDYAALITVPDDTQKDTPENTPARSFKEHTLQGRMRDEYLAICDHELREASALRAKLRAIEDMLRCGIRHIPDYAPSHELARSRLSEVADELEALLTPKATTTTERATETVLDLCTWLNLARRLNETATCARLIAHFDHLSQIPDLTAALWPVPATLLKEEADTEVGNRIMARIAPLRPVINRDVQNYFRWAMLAQRFEEAETLFKTLPDTLQRKHGALYYVNILQRQERFAEALSLLRDIHGQTLANPSLLNPVTNNSLIKRTGELEFLVETAEIYQSVPQPQNPKGVVLIAARNIDLMRRYPLMALLEFKRQGWAVIPMVGGLLPRELTGHAEIDILNGALTPSLRFTPEAAAAMPDLEDYEADPATGTLRWGDIDLSHSVWEDAAINRRRYNIDFSCPELQRYLGQLFHWTEAMCRMISYAHSQHLQTKRPTASISLFNCRLPDSMFRFFCEQQGDPDRFFYLHGANGYQNYFGNFKTNLSERYVLRNMTRTPQARSASFPLPENLKVYHQAKSNVLPAILKRFEDTTRIKRSTTENKPLPPEAIAANHKIAAWRAQGGKVVCAFGKVVCDSSVPYDGGPAHSSMKDWINHAIRAVKGSNTLLLIKPHPHELNNQIATFLTEHFEDLLEEELGENVMVLGHRWYDIHDMKDLVDLGLIYNGTTSVELGLLGIPCLLASHFAPIDYPIGNAIAKDRAEFEAYLRFEKAVEVAPDIRERAAVWLEYMESKDFTLPYGYHARPITNKVLYPPWWIKEDLKRYQAGQDPVLTELVARALGQRPEPGGTVSAQQ
jgi:hypothetical protein